MVSHAGVRRQSAKAETSTTKIVGIAVVGKTTDCAIRALTLRWTHTRACVAKKLYGVAAMKERAEILRHRIALYRRYLSEGVDAQLAAQYLVDIAGAEAELADLEKGTEKRE